MVLKATRPRALMLVALLGLAALLMGGSGVRWCALAGMASAHSGPVALLAADTLVEVDCCGQPIPPDAAVPGHCGASLPAPQEPASPSTPCPSPCCARAPVGPLVSPTAQVQLLTPQAQVEPRPEGPLLASVQAGTPHGPRAFHPPPPHAPPRVLHCSFLI